MRPHACSCAIFFRPVESQVRAWLAKETLEAKAELMESLGDENEDLREQYDLWADEFDADADMVGDPAAQDEV